MADDVVIIKLDCAKQALAEAKTIQQTKQIVDIARAAEIYAKRQRLSDDAIAYAHDIRFEALRLLGQMLKTMPKNTGAKGIGTSAVPKGNHTPSTLASMGLDKKTSMVAQHLADLPQTVFEQVRDGTVTFTKALQDTRRDKPTTVAWSIDSAEQRLVAAIHHEIELAPPGSHPPLAELLRGLAAKLEDSDRPELRDAVSIARDEMDVHDAEPGGFRVFENEQEASTHPGAPTVIASCKSTHQPWYRDLTTHKPGVTALKRKQIESRLDDIDRGKLPTKRTERTYWSVVWAIKDLPRTSPLSRGRGR